MIDSLKDLDLQNKESIVRLLFDVQAGVVSCRRAASEIQSKLPKPRLTFAQKATLRKLRAKGGRVKDLAARFHIHPSTVWRICKKMDLTALYRKLENERL